MLKCTIALAAGIDASVIGVEHIYSLRAEGRLSSWSGVLLAVLLSLAILCGGGGAEGPIRNGIIEAVSAVLLLVLAGVHLSGHRRLPSRAAVPLMLLLALLCILIVQLIPLPPPVWQGLPGRELMRSSLGLIGQENSWRPLSFDPEATRRFAASLLTPAAAMLAVLGATRREARLLIGAIITAAAISASIGALQLALDYPDWITFYDGPNPGNASGVFANANHHATLLLVALIALAVIIRRSKTRRTDRASDGFKLPFHIAWLGMPIFAVLIAATGSRAGLGLLLVALPASVGIALGKRIATLAGLALGAGAAAVLLLVILTGGSTGPIHRLFSGDLRLTYLPDMRFGLQQYWPWGSGAGTFPSVFATYENLDILQPEILNHAHNEYLEWLTDFGVAGALWLLAAAFVLGWRLVRLVRSSSVTGEQRWMAIGGLAMLVVLGCHSLVDYPLRTDAIAAIAGLAAGLSFAPLPEQRSSKTWRRGHSVALIAAIMLGALLGAQVLRLRAGEAMARARQSTADIRPQNGNGLAAAAGAALNARRFGEARSLASRAISRAPMSQSAVASLAAADTLAGRDGVAAWQVAAAMGWRDRPTQLWAMHQAFAAGEHATAAARADALLRFDTRVEHMSTVRSWATNEGFREALLYRLALQPSWRSKLLSLPPKPTVQELDGLVAILTALGQRKELRRADVRGAVETLLQTGRHQEAFQLYAMVQPPPRGLGSLNPDPGFDRAPAEYGSDGVAFDWQLSPAPGSGVEVDPTSKTLVIQSNGELARRVAYRYVALRAGSYALRYRSKVRAGAVKVNVVCASGTPLLGTSSALGGPAASFAQSQLMFSVPATCPVVVIEFVTDATGETVEAEFDDVMLSTN